MPNNEPGDFSFLSPEERLFVVQSRLPKLHQYLAGILVVQEHLRCIRKYDVFRSSPNDPARIPAVTITEMIENTLIVEVSGIWERFDGAGFSIPTICDALNAPDIIQILADRTDCPQIPDDSSCIVTAHDKSVPSISADLQQCFDRVRKTMGGEILTKVRNYRNKYASHPILATREERRKRTTISHPNPDDVEFLVEEAKQVLQTVYSSVFGYSYDYTQARQGIALHATRLYGGLRFSPVRAELALRSG